MINSSVDQRILINDIQSPNDSNNSVGGDISAQYFTQIINGRQAELLAMIGELDYMKMKSRIIME